MISSLAKEGGFASTLWAGPESFSRAVKRGERSVQATLKMESQAEIPSSVPAPEAVYRCKICGIESPEVSCFAAIATEGPYRLQETCITCNQPFSEQKVWRRKVALILLAAGPTTYLVATRATEQIGWRVSSTLGRRPSGRRLAHFFAPFSKVRPRGAIASDQHALRRMQSTNTRSLPSRSRMGSIILLPLLPFVRITVPVLRVRLT